MPKKILRIQYDFSKEFGQKAYVSDVLFMIFCLIYPFFLPNRFIFVLIYGFLGNLHMHNVVKILPNKRLIYYK